MKMKTEIRHSQMYHEEGMGTVTLMLSIAIIVVISFSIFNTI